MSFFPEGRRPEEPFCLAANRDKPYTYRCASADLRARLMRVGERPDLATLHGVRVEGYNCSLRANGERRTVIHGLWSGPQSAARYLRLDIATEIVPMAGNVVRRYQNGTSDPDSGEELELPPVSDEGVSDDDEIPERSIHPRQSVRPRGGRQRPQLAHLRPLLLQPPHVPLLAIVQPALQLPLLPGLLPPRVGSLLLPPRGGLLLDSGLGHGHAT